MGDGIGLSKPTECSLLTNRFWRLVACLFNPLVKLQFKQDPRNLCDGNHYYLNPLVRQDLFF